VLDADGLNLIAEHNLLSLVPAGAVLTPHPGEFARLSGASSEDFFTRAGEASRFAAKHKLVLLLKGAPTITFDKHGQGVVNSTGNPGLATAGSGDVLTGIVSALLAQDWTAIPPPMSPLFCMAAPRIWVLMNWASLP